MGTHGSGISRVFRLYAEYLCSEYGDLDSDYVFVSLFAQKPGRALSFGAVYDLVSRLRRRSGIAFTPHMFRHTYATRLLRQGVGLEVVQRLLGHASPATTLDTYGHLRAEDLRTAMRRAGALEAQAATATADHAGGDAPDNASAVRLW